MKVLFILPYHNASAAVFENGQCLEYLHEEKFTNIKSHWGFPGLSVDYLVNKYSLKSTDHVVFSGKQLLLHTLPKPSSNLAEDIGTNPHLRQLTNYVEYKTKAKKLFFTIRSIFLDKIISPLARNQMRQYLLTRYNVPTNNTHFFDHHLCHALSPVHFYNLHSQTHPILIFTMDGSGDNYFSKTFIYYPANNKLKPIAKSRFDSSLGLLYSGLTQFLGMKPYEHEYKVMGLAAYPNDPKYYQNILIRLQKDFGYDQKSQTFQSSFNTNYSFYYFKEHFVGQRFDNLAAALQTHLDNLITLWITTTIKKYHIHTIALSGGVFMNVKVNKLIQELPLVKKAYFMPSAGDESLGWGAAYQIFSQRKINTQSNSTMFLGLNYSNQQIQAFIKKNRLDKKFDIKYLKNPSQKIANLLSHHQVVAWFTGAGEWGARSLCHRTILANASDFNSYHQVNDAIKMRDFWMPFAPTILFDWAPRYIKNWQKLKNKIKESSKYMITAFDSTPLAQKHLIAAIHSKDKSLRPQLVEKSDHPTLYRLLKYFEKYTGMGGVMNTSLNIHGYPLVGNLNQAIFTLENSQLKYLVLENYLLIKK